MNRHISAANLHSMVEAAKAQEQAELHPVRIGELPDATQKIQAEIDALGSAVQKLESQLAPVLSKYGSAENTSDPQPEYRSVAGGALYRQADMLREIFKTVTNLSQRLEV